MWEVQAYLDFGVVSRDLHRRRSPARRREPGRPERGAHEEGLRAEHEAGESEDPSEHHRDLWGCLGREKQGQGCGSRDGDMHMRRKTKTCRWSVGSKPRAACARKFRIFHSVRTPNIGSDFYLFPICLIYRGKNWIYLVEIESWMGKIAQIDEEDRRYGEKPGKRDKNLIWDDIIYCYSSSTPPPLLLLLLLSSAAAAAVIDCCCSLCLTLQQQYLWGVAYLYRNSKR